MNKLEFVTSHGDDLKSFNDEQESNKKTINALKFKNQLLKEKFSLPETQAEYEENLRVINELEFANTLLAKNIVKSQNIIASALVTEEWD
ncbi:MAG: hypothetical protein R3Y32_06850 [Bacillota bacterium]